MTQHDCAHQTATGLRKLGILPGHTILVHSSFRSLGPVPGGIETVIRGLLEAIGPDGTLVMPALSWALRPPDAFDVMHTPVNVGAVPEYFRTRAGTRRSVHPTHSVCAVGRRTSELLDAHALDSTPCGPNSPFRKLAETGGTIVMLGCGLEPNTTMHALEEYVEPPYLFGPSVTFTITDESGRTYRKQYRTHGFDGVAQRYERIAELDSGAFVSRGKVLEADTYVIDAPLLKGAVLEKLRRDPYCFVETVTRGE